SNPSAYPGFPPPVEQPFSGPSHQWQVFLRQVSLLGSLTQVLDITSSLVALVEHHKCRHREKNPDNGKPQFERTALRVNKCVGDEALPDQQPHDPVIREVVFMPQQLAERRRVLIFSNVVQGFGTSVR